MLLDVQVFVKDEVFYGKLTSDPPQETVKRGKIHHQQLVNASVKYQQNVSVPNSADTLEKLLDFVRPRYDRYSLPIPGLLCPQARADGAVCGALAYVRYEGFCREHMLDAMESCEDILETYREYIDGLKKWARLGTPRHLQHVRPLHARILEELVGGMSQKPGRSPVKWDSF